MASPISVAGETSIVPILWWASAVLSHAECWMVIYSVPVGARSRQKSRFDGKMISFITVSIHSLLAISRPIKTVDRYLRHRLVHLLFTHTNSLFSSLSSQRWQQCVRKMLTVLLIDSVGFLILNVMIFKKFRFSRMKTMHIEYNAKKQVPAPRVCACDRENNKPN